MIMSAFRTVFREGKYLALAGIVGLATFALAIWFPNLRLLRSVWFDHSITLGDKVILPIRLLGSISTNFTILSAAYTIAAAFLTGINIALIAYILKRQKMRLSSAGVTAGAFGVFSGGLGVGCAACGSLVLSTFLATAGGASVLTLLPLKGGEFGILSMLVLGMAAYFLSKNINKPPVCDITVEKL